MSIPDDHPKPPQDMPANMVYPPLQQAPPEPQPQEAERGEWVSRHGEGRWRAVERRRLWVIIYSNHDVPLVVCRDEDQALSIAVFLNQIPGFDATDLPRTVWMPTA